MATDGPSLESLLHRLTDCPDEFLTEPLGSSPTELPLAAIVCDHLRAVNPDEPPELQRAFLRQLDGFQPMQQRWIAIVCWLLHDPWFRTRSSLAAAMWKLYVSDELEQLSRLVKPDKLIHDPDRREELVRVCLRALGLRANGETESQAADRLAALDSAERARVLRATAAAERRAREIREQMARAAAQDAASRYGE